MSNLTFSGLVRNLVLPLGNEILALLTSIALLVFMYGMVRYMISDHKKEEWKKIILWGIISLFVLVCIGGILALLNYTVFGSGAYSGTSVPQASPF